MKECSGLLTTEFNSHEGTTEISCLFVSDPEKRTTSIVQSRLAVPHVLFFTDEELKTLIKELKEVEEYINLYPKQTEQEKLHYNISKYLQDAMRETNISIDTVAEKLGMHSNALKSLIFAGNMSIGLYFNICKLLDISAKLDFK